MKYNYFIKLLLEKNVKNRIFTNRKSALWVDVGHYKIQKFTRY